MRKNRRPVIGTFAVAVILPIVLYRNVLTQRTYQESSGCE
jgi:hypothetical protein